MGEMPEFTVMLKRFSGVWYPSEQANVFVLVTVNQPHENHITYYQ